MVIGMKTVHITAFFTCLASASLGQSVSSLPSVTGPIPETSQSHIFNGAAWQVEPIHLEDYGFTEEEFFVSGPANVYDLEANGNYAPVVLREGEYTTRITIRRPADMSEFSGRVVVEMINPSAWYDWTAMWAALWERVVANGDIYVGITSKPVVFGALQSFDSGRYAPLSMTNPLPPAEQTCGFMPGDDDFTPDLSREYENGLVWDAVSQLSMLLRSDDPSNPLGVAARQVFLTGESQTGNYGITYYRYIHEDASRALGAPIFDGYLLEAATTALGAPINQCAEPLADDDTQIPIPGRGVPLMMINSQWDMFTARGTDRKPDSDSPDDMSITWELAGANHGWRWQYLYGDADHGDLARAGMLEGGEWTAWECGPGRIEVPLYMAEKAMYEAMIRWVDFGVTPPAAPAIETDESGQPRYDSDQTALGGLRLPMVSVPVTSFGEGRAVLSDGCPELVPFPQEDLIARYGNVAGYLSRYQEAVWSMVRQGYLLPEDVPALMAEAEAVTF